MKIPKEKNAISFYKSTNFVKSVRNLFKKCIHKCFLKSDIFLNYLLVLKRRIKLNEK